MAILGRRKDAPQLAAPPAAALPKSTVGEPCSEWDCDRHDAIRCVYRDRLGQWCDTAWCPGHIPKVDGQAYCRRHAGVVKALMASPSKSHPPDLNNRAASLANWVAEDLDVAIRHLLSGKVDALRNEELVVEPLTSFFSPDDQRYRWERAWTITGSNDVRRKVSIDVDEANDCVVRVCVDSIAVALETPPWVGRENREKIRSEADPQADHRRRQEFYVHLLDLVAPVVSVR